LKRGVITIPDHGLASSWQVPTSFQTELEVRGC
jgi:hypothetical protein